MISPLHDEVLDAFMRVGGPINRCDRGGRANDRTIGYTHIHGSSRPPSSSSCRNHLVYVEKYNGTVAVRDPIAEQLGGEKRPGKPIQEHPLGYSQRNDFGSFQYALSMQAIQSRWDTLDDFAKDVIAACRRNGYTW